MVRLCVVAVALLAVSGCDDDESGRAATGRIVFERSGGFATVHERLRVLPDGTARLTTGPPAREVITDFELRPSERSRLRAAIRDTDLGEIDPSDENRICADCFSYRISYGGESLAFDQASVHKEVKRLLGVLSSIANRR